MIECQGCLCGFLGMKIVLLYGKVRTWYIYTNFEDYHAINRISRFS